MDAIPAGSGEPAPLDIARRRCADAFARLRGGLARGILAIALLGCCGCSEVQLYTGLQEREANEMMAILMQQGIPCSKLPGEEGTWNLQTPEERFAEAIQKLNALGYPKESYSRMGDVFQKSGLVSSPTEERIRFMDALQQELANTISQIDGVLTARVHIVLPENNPFGENVAPSSAAVFIKHRRDAEMETSILDVKELVMASIEGMSPEKVTVVLFPADDLELAAVPLAEPQTVEVLGIQVSPGSARRLWAALGGAALIAALGLALAVWGALRRRSLAAEAA